MSYEWDVKVRIYDPIPVNPGVYIIKIWRVSKPTNMYSTIERFNWSTSEWEPVSREDIWSQPHIIGLRREELLALRDAIRSYEIV